MGVLARTHETGAICSRRSPSEGTGRQRKWCCPALPEPECYRLVPCASLPPRRALIQIAPVKVGESLPLTRLSPAVQPHGHLRGDSAVEGNVRLHNGALAKVKQGVSSHVSGVVVGGKSLLGSAGWPHQPRHSPLE
jgi:hypothetical protein